MKIIRDYDHEQPDRICHLLTEAAYEREMAHGGAMVAIDEAFLAWFYIAPGQPLSATSRSALALARALIGEGAWAVVQAQNDDPQALLRDFDMAVVESYENTADDPVGVSVHIAQAVPPTPPQACA